MWRKDFVILANPHLWAISCISLALLLFYSAWPWQEWRFTGRWEAVSWLAPLLYEIARAEWLNRAIGVFFLIPILYASFVFSWPGALATTLISLAGVWPITLSFRGSSTFIANTVTLIVPFCVVSVITLTRYERDKRRKEREFLAAQEAERQRYLLKILETQEDERRRIAQDLHDDAIQTLLFIAHSAESLACDIQDQNAETSVRILALKDSVIHAADDLRAVCMNLRSHILDNLGMVAALRWLVSCVNNDWDVDARITIEGAEQRLSPFAESVLYRVVQEALNNIRRHSKARCAEVQLEFGAASLNMTIRDDGEGFDPSRTFEELAVQGKFGLIGIRQRVSLISGRLTIASGPGEGTLLTIEVPF